MLCFSFLFLPIDLRIFPTIANCQ